MLDLGYIDTEILKRSTEGRRIKVKERDDALSRSAIDKVGTRT
jgi:hypothetical protein